MPDRRRWLAVEIGAALAVVAAVLVVAGRDGGTTTPAPVPPAATTTSSTPAPTAPLTGPALAIKIDNVPAVLRDGQSFTATWSRPAERSSTTFHTADGQELLLAPGPVWVLLTPA